MGENELIDHKLNDKASGIYCTFFSLGEILAPNLGSILYKQIGYRKMCDLMALTALLYASVYFALNVGFNIFEKERRHREKLEMLKKGLFKFEYDIEKS